MAIIGLNSDVNPSSLVNANPVSINVNTLPGTNVASGALTADTYPGTAQINITGAGVLNFVSFYAADATSRTVTIKVVLDGTQIIEQASSTSATNSGAVVIGGYSGGLTFDQIPFFTSLAVFLKSNLSETDKAVLKYVTRLV